MLLSSVMTPKTAWLRTAQSPSGTAMPASSRSVWNESFRRSGCAIYQTKTTTDANATPGVRIKETSPSSRPKTMESYLRYGSRPMAVASSMVSVAVNGRSLMG